MGKGLMDYGKVLDDATTQKLVEQIKAEDIRRIACSVFGPGKLSTLIYI